jgi:type I restriction enzyme M protein
MQADGYSLDDKRQPLLSEDKLGLHRLSGMPQQLSEQDQTKNNLPDVLARWAKRDSSGEGGERQRPRTAQSFCVPKADIAAQGYDLSINRYKEVVHAVVEHESPQAILARLAVLEDEIRAGMKALEGMLK